MAIADEAVRDEEANALFSGLENLRGLVLAVSGGADSTALLVIAARWAEALEQRRKRRPKLIAVTVDHGLRPQSAQEATAVKRLAGRLGVSHRTLHWHGRKPKTGLQEAARNARYRLLAAEAVRAGYEHILTAHTLDDQAETILFRLARGSGVTGLAGMAPASLLPVSIAPTSSGKRSGEQKTSAGSGVDRIFLVRPLLHVPKRRLVATLQAHGIDHSEDPTNRDPRFARTRLRTLLPRSRARGARRKRVLRVWRRACGAQKPPSNLRCLPRARPWRRGPGATTVRSPSKPRRFGDLPAEVALRLLGRAIVHAGNEGPVELGKLEMLYDALRQSRSRIRRTLAGALITLTGEWLSVERAPSRRTGTARAAGNRSFTKRQ